MTLAAKNKQGSPIPCCLNPPCSPFCLFCAMVRNHCNYWTSFRSGEYGLFSAAGNNGSSAVATDLEMKERTKCYSKHHRWCPQQNIVRWAGPKVPFGAGTILPIDGVFQLKLSQPGVLNVGRHTHPKPASPTSPSTSIPNYTAQWNDGDCGLQREVHWDTKSKN